MKFLFAIISISLSALLSAEESAVLGKIGDIEVRTDEVREVLAGLEAGQETKIPQDPAALGQYVRALLVQRLVLKESLEKKWDQDPAVVTRLVRAREAALTETYLESVSKPVADYPSEDDLKAAYEANKDKLLVPRAFHLAQIFIAVPKDADKPATGIAQAKLDEAVKALKAKNADFAAIARTFSEETASAAKGGEIGWITEAQIQPEIRERLPKLAINTISEPVRLNDGWHILKILEVREPSTPPLEQIRPQFVAQLRTERARLNRQEFIAKLIEKNPLAINEIELSKILPQSN